MILQLSPHEKITDLKKFLESHEAISKNANPRFDVYRNRLKKVRLLMVELNVYLVF